MRYIAAENKNIVKFLKIQEIFNEYDFVAFGSVIINTPEQLGCVCLFELEFFLIM